MLYRILRTKWYTILLLAFACVQFTLAQSPSTSTSVSGTVVDSADGSRLEFVNISLFSIEKNAQDRLLGGTISSETGGFSIENAPIDKDLYLRLSSIGYKEFKTKTFRLSSSKPKINLGKISLVSSAIALESVEIKGQKKFLEFGLDKQIVNVEQMPIADGGSAADILQEIPAVNVDENGVVSLRGSENVTILMDGRPVVLSQDAGIEQIAAENIASIEILTNPSAKYNPEGGAGIINIISKKELKQSFSGSVNVSSSTNNNHRIGGSLRATFKRFQIDANLDLNFRRTVNNGYTSTVTEKKFDSLFNREWEYGTSQRIRFGGGGNVGIGASYNISDKDNIAARFSTNMWGGTPTTTNPGTVLYHYLASETQDLLLPDEMEEDFEKELFRTLYSKSVNSRLFMNMSGGLSYAHQFAKKDQKLSIDATINKSRTRNKSDVERNIFYKDDTSSNRQISLNNGDGLSFDGQINYFHPFTQKISLEVGYQAKISNRQDLSSESLRVYALQDSVTDFSYLDQNHGVYANFGGQFGRFSMQLGGRMEVATISANTITDLRDTSFGYFYPRFYPAVHLSYKITDMQNIQLSYTRRVSRPRPWDLNPFLDYSNYPTSLSSGNPNLIPEDVHAIELNYSIFVKASSFYVSVFYKHMDDLIKRYQYEREDGILMETMLNYATASNYGINLSYDQRLFKWWRLSFNTHLHRNLVSGGNIDSTLNRKGLNYLLKLNNSFNFGKNWSIQLSCTYVSPQIDGQNRRMGNLRGSLAVRKDFFNNKLGVTLNVRDLFFTQKRDFYTYGNNFVSHTYRRDRMSTSVQLSISYKFNDIKQRAPKKKGLDNEEMRMEEEE